MNFKNIKSKNVDWGTMLFIVIYQSLLLISLPFYFAYNTPGKGLIISTIILIALTGISITAGYHRLYAHKSYSINNKIVESVILFFSTMSIMGSVFEWASKHRLHHRYADREGDPYNVKKGFFHAHIFWMFFKRKMLDESTIPDLLKKRMLQFQHKHIASLTVITNLIAFAFVAWITKDILGTLIFALGLRIFVVHHFTWLINSAAHYWGAKTYSKEQSAVNNALIAFFTFGEGYHNYHHVFASDYRNGVKWYQYDPTKWLIWTLSKLGFAGNLKTVDRITAQNKIVNEDRYIFLKALRESTYEKKHELEQRIKSKSEQLNEKLSNLKKAIKDYRELKKNRTENHNLKHLKKRIRELKNNFRKEWKSWRNLEKEVSSHAVLHHHFH